MSFTHLFQPTKPPEVREEAVSVRHTLMDEGPRYHDSGRVEDVVRRLIRRREAEYRRRQRKKALQLKRRQADAARKMRAAQERAG